MKIITIFPKYSEALFNKKSNRTFGGADVQMYMITKELSHFEDIDIQSFIVNYKEINFDEPEKFRLVKTFNEDDNILKKFLVYHKKIFSIKPDVIIQRGLTFSSCLLALYSKFFRIKFVFMFAHDIESHGRYQKSHRKCLIFPLLLKCSTLLIVQNKYEYDTLYKTNIEKKIRILKKGLELDKVQGNKNKEYDSIWIARCEKWKNPETFIELAKKNPDLKFKMICSPAKGREKYHEQIKKIAINIKNLSFINFIDNRKLYSLLARCKTFCITSDMEGDWPMTVLESTVSGLPILSFKLNYGELISKYKAGFFCNNNISFLSECLNNLINDETLYKDMSSKAIIYAHENHDIKINIKKLIEHLKSIL